MTKFDSSKSTNFEARVNSSLFEKREIRENFWSSTLNAYNYTSRWAEFLNLRNTRPEKKSAVFFLWTVADGCHATSRATRVLYIVHALAKFTCAVLYSTGTRSGMAPIGHGTFAIDIIAPEL